jgi:GT2 family glycosyltransferase
MSSKILCIVIPVYGQLFYTKKVLKSIEEQVVKAYDRVVIFVVDNASTDGTDKWLAQEWLSKGRDKYIISNLTNLGYGPAINRALKFILQTDFLFNSDILVMNNDMELLPHCIDKLKEASETYKEKKVGIVGGKLLFPDGTIQHAGAYLNAFGWGQHKHGGIQDKYIFASQRIEPQEFVTGALLLITHECLSEVGLFDEQFAPAYFEEVDLIFRARDKGFETIYAPESRAIHYENITSKALDSSGNAPTELSHKNQVKFYLKREQIPYIPISEKKILLCCQIHGLWSFVTVMRNLAKGLSQNGVDVSIAPQDYHTGEGIDDWEIKKMVDKPHDYWDRVVLRSAEGDDMVPLPPGKQRIAHTTGENSRVNPAWVSQLNHVDKVITTSLFFKNVMEEGGVKTPIFVLPNAVDTSIFQPTGNRLPLGDLKGFNFVSVFHFGTRKAPEVLIRAFAEEFSPDEDVSLTIHSLHMQNAIESQLKISLKEWVSRICDNRPHAPMYITTDPMRMELIGSFYRNFDVMVIPTRCEGFGNPLAEAGACGLPSIVTGYSGVLDIVDNTTGWLLDYELQPMPLQLVPYFKNYLGGIWAEPSIAHLRKLLRHTFDNREEVTKKGQAALKKSHQFSIAEVGKLAKQVIFGDM